MSSLRAIRSASTALRAFAPARAYSQRSIASWTTRVVLSRSAIQPLRAFSVSARTFGPGETDLELSSKLQEELQYEKESAEAAGPVPEFVKEFKASGTWKIEEAAGHDEVVLTRLFGNESIRVLFSIADIDTPQEAPEYEADGEPAPEEEEHSGAPIRVSVTISKPKSGALSIDCVTQDGGFGIDNVSFYGDSKLATELTPEADWSRRGLYIGPQFDHLDVGVQEAFEKYLEERGVGASLAAFIPDYAEFKEQQEYTRWLENVHKFVSS